MNSKEIKSILIDLGADISGISGVDRFKDAPEGYKPSDIFSECKSVIVFAKKVPKTSLFSSTAVPYTNINRILTDHIDSLAINLCSILENKGVSCVPIPSEDPYDYWDQENMEGRGILSLRHAGYFAGLGTLAKNTLLVNNKYGNMIFIGAVLVDIELEEDPMANYDCCSPKCSICMDSCPQKALDGITVDQKLCRTYSMQANKKGYVLYSCSTCRSVCPNFDGIKKSI